MRFKPTSFSIRCVRPGKRAFTLAEVLAAVAFMAIVIPVAVHGIRIANLSGQVAQRKSAAARLADRLLNESLVTDKWKSSTQSGSVQEGPYQYRWQLKSDSWDKDALKQISIVVTFAVQGQDYNVRLGTLADTSVDTSQQ